MLGKGVTVFDGTELAMDMAFRWVDGSGIKDTNIAGFLSNAGRLRACQSRLTCYAPNKPAKARIFAYSISLSRQIIALSMK
jgi:hypothetical protein